MREIISPNFVCTFEHLSGVTFGSIAVSPLYIKFQSKIEILGLIFHKDFPSENATCCDNGDNSNF